ncbi:MULTISPECIES: glutaredoxin family protein [Idiomarina]|jgi:glutaredoxin|uniref:glutaredoxin family protein n=1 Tax=Idiomarina TaxID=135575 RepID=UPI0006C834A0|nr:MULTISPECIES: glutathione S-transferase N-terminal domain-containing protein [Idiomarina]KPD22708.1 glutaredoxin [Idiomarina abyssalis]MAB22678.1 glutaredoxin [Idiomarina sp.]MBH95381.1 glutaredoxin [Idiomarina sp.]MDA6065947.1 glutathione S-transferase N-terminal domain-containing protein [Idiomarina abyssalis]SFT46083.1 Glutathione S-transferase, N-terminal domain [Idiomarina abyssalis]|tara:strand:+ start:2470 stop:2853 length:384 start_codon:yes stop_codon:yes gene_type:complete
MRIIIRYFFRGLRLVLTPIVLLVEKLTTPKGKERSEQEQKQVDEACKSLALYQFAACPFCVKVRKEIARLNLNIELRDAKNNDEHRNALLNGGGRVKVPCLRIEEGDKVQWMYESDDINQYLENRFA